MRLALETSLPIAAADAFARVRTPALLEHVAAPLLRFVPIDPPVFPPFWAESDYRVQVKLFGVVPLGRQTIAISIGALEGAFAVRDNGSGDLAQRWDHRITIVPDGEGRCTYRDEVEIEAGPLTPIVWAFANYFYRHRQRRWRKLATAAGASMGSATAGKHA